GVIGVGNSIGYCASKGALVVMSKAMALDLAPEGIRVNALCPGVVDTPFNDEILATMDDPQGVLAAQCGAHPLGRLATPVDVANATAFLASDQSLFITGSTFMVDGGLTAQ
ncbi:MAG: SDR family oxidoreductase, partial [Propionibacteriaceae bacterium]|nr:SDR family oxidoreductase [Propionibacteriaceae bacterium]